MDDTAIMGCIWDVQEEEYRSLVVTGLKLTQAQTQNPWQGRQCVYLHWKHQVTIHTQCGMGQGSEGPGKREISPTQAPLLRSFFTHTLAWLVSQETDPGWIYRHAQKSLIRKRSQETHRL